MVPMPRPPNYLHLPLKAGDSSGTRHGPIRTRGTAAAGAVAAAAATVEAVAVAVVAVEATVAEATATETGTCSWASAVPRRPTGKAMGAGQGNIVAKLGGMD